MWCTAKTVAVTAVTTWWQKHDSDSLGPSGPHLPMKGVYWREGSGPPSGTWSGRTLLQVLAHMVRQSVIPLWFAGWHDLQSTLPPCDEPSGNPGTQYACGHCLVCRPHACRPACCITHLARVHIDPDVKLLRAHTRWTDKSTHQSVPEE